MTPILIAITLLAVYTITLCVANNEIPSSLSASVFYLPKAGQWLWTAVIVVVVFLVAPTLIEKASDNTQFLAFLACVGLLYVGGAPLVKETWDMSYKVHMVGAFLCAISAQLLLAFNCWWLLLAWVPWIVVFAVFWKQKRTWRTKVFWAEMTCFANTFAFALI